jgi:hypothetical protein
MARDSLPWTFAKYALWVVSRRLYGLIQGVVWLLNGTYLTLWRSRSPGNDYWSAQLLDIVARYKLDLVLEQSGPQNFLTTHAGFVSPSYVLQDNVTLYYVTATEAVFVETKEELDVTHSDYGAFLRVAQFENARRIVRVPIEAFHRLAESLGDPKGKIVFVTNTGRCGSTLLSQIYEETGRCLSLSEPDALNAIAVYKYSWPQDKLDRLVRNSVRIQCKPLRDRPMDAYVLKPTAPTVDAVSMLLRIFPDSKQIFMYREGLKVAQSLVRSAKGMPMLGLTFILTTLHPRLCQMSIEAMGLPAKEFKVKLSTPLVFSVYVWAVFCSKYLALRRDPSIPIVAVKYEDLVKHKLESTRAVLRFTGLPEEWAEKAIAALDKDSQRHSPLSMKNLSTEKPLELSDSELVQTDAICDKLGLPRVPAKCDLEGTITTPPKQA